MNPKSNKSKIMLFRLFISLPLLLLVGVGAYLIFSRETISLGEFVLSDTDLPPIRLVEETVREGLDISAIANHRGGMHKLHATTTRIEDFSFFNEGELVDFENDLHLNDSQDTVYVIFANILPELDRFETAPPLEREYFILKVFYEFEEIDFKVAHEGTFQTEFLFHLAGGYQAHIPIELPETIETTNQLANLTIAIFANPHYNTVNPLAEWYSHCEFCPSGVVMHDQGDGIVVNFALSVGERFTRQEEALEETYPTFWVNPEFLHEQGGVMHGPPSPWTVSSGEEVKIGFAVYNGIYLQDPLRLVKIEDFVIIGLLNWEQIDLNGMPYVLESRPDGIAVDETVEGYFVMTAPSEPGYYDFVAFAITNSNEPNHFQHVERATRFTLKVE